MFRIDKNTVKKIGLGVAATTLALGSLYGGYYLSGHGSNVNAEKTEDVATAANTVDQLTEANILTTVFARMRIAHDNNEVLSQEVLDSLAFYVIAYYQSGRSFVSNGAIETPTNGLAQLEDLYKQSGVECSFKHTSTDEQDEVTLTRELKKPANFDNLVKKTEKAVEDKLTDGDNTKARKSGEMIDADVEISEDDLSLGETK